ncbi:putative NADPH-dependent FMN reductase [Phaeobacter inhibens]|uniref:Putative NADPH-dependent FMN reductase n=1 Tax=Phaeobacter inhibens TaxID=221822 RepID=A0A135IFT4_9RHOB|nr:NAD(P)H-dependent oxidoreductase [Phaeobacter inhibens]AFO88668.1 putative NADPH-dependent FMN reductase [Phaeobacter inhibens 2.10]APX15737.1 NADPH-dependent oxidoreductase [Phaeobacter inhibens]AUQ71653.1 putative NADPH-dependent FMN reductase [Phaeobacter inhibens]AUR00272.1 putative NADPH-dependent FMN reductase [Phaeobacter inhibens]AUR04884.1 putative NADPH-dependent FMN reductase [Phaeobacter inhibens]
MSDPKLLTISGSLRAGATNRKLLAEAARLFGPAEVTEADLNLPLYDGDDEQASGIPAAVQTLADQIGAADAVIISTPEYNGAPSGVLKNALDWVSRTSNKPWQDKPVAIMSAAAGRAGGEKSQMLLRTFLVPFQPRVLTAPQVHLAASHSEFDEGGRLLSELYTETLEALMTALRAEIAR